MHKPLRSPRIDNPAGKVLTDARIDHYLREGKYYSPKQQQAYKNRMAQRRKIRRMYKQISSGDDPEVQPETKAEWKDFFSFLD